MIHQLVNGLLGVVMAMAFALPSPGASTAVVNPSSTISVSIGVSTQVAYMHSSIAPAMTTQDTTKVWNLPDLFVTKSVDFGRTSRNMDAVKAIEVENANTYVLFCQGDNMGAGQVIDGCFENLVLYMNGADCNFQCSCNNKGTMSCHMPAKYCGNDLAIASYCGSPHAHFTCYCKPTSYPSNIPRVTALLDRDTTSTLDPEDLILTTYPTLPSVFQITPLLYEPVIQPREESGRRQELADNIVVGQRPSTSQGIAQPRQVQRAKELDPPKTSASSINSMVSTEQTTTPLLCFGEDLKKTYYVGVCMDGTLMYWSGDDCQSNCKCSNSGELQCEVDSDCGPTDAVAKACSQEATFTCSCVNDK